MKSLWILLATTLTAAAAQGGAPVSDHTPKDWLAFVAHSGGFAPAVFAVVNATPQVLVYRSGKVVWCDVQRSADGSRRDPEIWREGQADPKALAGFIASVKSGPFLTAKPAPQGGGVLRPGPAISDAGMTHVGVDLGNAGRIVRITALENVGRQPDADVYTRSTAAMRDAILALRPAQSRRYDPETIRVGFYRGSGEGVPWPLKDKPALTAGQFTYYSGPDARTVIATLARNNQVRVGDSTLRADWAPALDIPTEVRAPAAKP